MVTAAREIARLTASSMPFADEPVKSIVFSTIFLPSARRPTGLAAIRPFAQAAAQGVIGAEQAVGARRIEAFEGYGTGRIGGFDHVVDHAAELGAVLQRSGSAHNFDSLYRLERRAVMARRVAVDVGVGHHAVLPHVEFPAPVRVEPARRHIDLVAGAVHVVDEHAGDLGERLPAGLLRQVDRRVLQLNDFVLFA